MNFFREFEEFGAQIQQCVLPLVVKIDDEIILIGTGFVINNSGLFVTAKHVLVEAQKNAVSRRREDGIFYKHYEFYGIYASNQENGVNADFIGGWLPVTNIWYTNQLDMGLGWFKLPRNTDDNSLLKLYPVRIRPALPKLGDELIAAGYYKMEGKITGESKNIVKYKQDTAYSGGRVVQVHPEFRDSVRLNFPCFQTDARFEGGMSGGPIFDKKTGNVVGVVCSSFESIDEEDEKSFISYGSLIWPILGSRVKISLGHGEPLKSITLYELFELGAINVDETIERIRVSVNESGKIAISLLDS